MRPLLPPLAQFEAWLMGQPYDHPVGRRLDCTGCPLALWLQAALRSRCVVVDEVEIAIDRGMDEWVRTRTPPDYRLLIELLDYNGGTERSVTVTECRKALHVVLEA
jgi:hypothetical protein